MINHCYRLRQICDAHPLRLVPPSNRRPCAGIEPTYVKILPASNELERHCEKGDPYPGAKPHYIVEEGQLSTIESLPAILCAVAEAISQKKPKAKRKRPL